MTKKEKLLARFLSKPKDFTWGEMQTLMARFGYEELKGGGSRRKFLKREGMGLVILHEPHPSPVMKPYMINDAIGKLRESGDIA